MAKSALAILVDLQSCRRLFTHTAMMAFCWGLPMEVFPENLYHQCFAGQLFLPLTLPASFIAEAGFMVAPMLLRSLLSPK